MKYTVEGLNQGRLLELGLDGVDAIILRWYLDFLPTMRQVQRDGTAYGWVAYAHLLRDLPIIGITDREALGRRFKKYKAAGLMRGYVDRKDENKTYFAMVPEVLTSLIDSVGGSRSKSREAPVSKVGRLPFQKSDDPSTSDPSANDPKIAAVAAAPGHSDVVAHYQERFIVIHGRKPAWNPAMFKNLSSLLKSGQPSVTVIACVDVYFDYPALWFRKGAGHDFSQFLTHYNELLSLLPAVDTGAESERIRLMEMAVGIRRPTKDERVQSSGGSVAVPEGDGGNGQGLRAAAG
jgi:hypothetical protein